MDNESQAIVYCRILTTVIATLHLALSSVLDFSYGYVPVIFACFLSIILPNFVLVVKVRNFEKKSNLVIQNRILNFLARDRVITWNEVHFSIAVSLASLNLFACYVNLAIRIPEHRSAVYIVLPTILSFALLLLCLFEAVLSFRSIKNSPRPAGPQRTKLNTERMDKFMNFLAERLVLIQIPLLILSFVWHYMSMSDVDRKHVGVGTVAANFIQYPLTIMISVFFHARLVRYVQSRIGKCGLHVYGVQYTILLNISALSASCFVLNLALIIHFNGSYNKFFYLISPYLTCIVSLLQAFALAGHQSWNDFNARYHHENINGHLDCSVIEMPTDNLTQEEQTSRSQNSAEEMVTERQLSVDTSSSINE